MIEKTNFFPSIGKINEYSSEFWWRNYLQRKLKANQNSSFSEIEIRRIFLTEDADQIRTMQAKAQVFRDHYPQHRSWLEMALREVLDGTRVAFGVYRSGFNDSHTLTFSLVGSIILKLNHFNGTVELKNLFISEQSRRRGYGKEILLKCEDYCTKAGFSAIETEVPIDEVGTVSFLHKAGFRVTAAYNSPYKPGDSLYKGSLSRLQSEIR